MPIKTNETPFNVISKEEAHKNIEDSQLSHDMKFQADDVTANTTSDKTEVAGAQEYNEIGEVFCPYLKRSLG